MRDGCVTPEPEAQLQERLVLGTAGPHQRRERADRLDHLGGGGVLAGATGALGVVGLAQIDHQLGEVLVEQLHGIGQCTDAPPADRFSQNPPDEHQWAQGDEEPIDARSW